MNLFNSDPNSFEFEISGLKNYKDPGYNLLKKPILIRINKIFAVKDRQKAMHLTDQAHYKLLDLT